MEEIYLFWNTFNIFAVMAAMISVGLLIGSFVSNVISIATQVNDPAISIFSKLSGLIIGFYVLSPYILKNIKEFSIMLWDKI